jgi:hypothetical protein
MFTLSTAKLKLMVSLASKQDKQNSRTASEREHFRLSTKWRAMPAQVYFADMRSGLQEKLYAKMKRQGVSVTVTSLPSGCTLVQEA